MEIQKFISTLFYKGGKMKKRITAFLLALIMVAQVLAPEITWAIKEGQNYPKEDNKLVEVGKTGAENYPKLTNKVILDIQKETTLNSRKNIQNKTGVLPFNTPYLPGQDIPDEDKPRIVGKVFADFKTIGLDGGTFDWEGVFGKDSNGNPGKAKLVFQQWLNNKETNVSYELEVSKDGTYSWKDWQGEPARIPLYSKSLEPYTYSVYLDQDVSEKVKLLTYRIAGTPSGGGFEKDPETGLNIANIVIDLSIQQVASTKFVSEWHTGLAKDARPPVEGEFDNKIDEFPGYFPFSLENNGQIIIRNDFVNNSDYEDPGYTEFGSSSLVKKPEVKVTEGLEFADDNDEEGSPTYNLDEANKTITTLDKQHKFKYDFTYDVINGGKLTMTEVIPVTFDANGGKFEKFTAPDTEGKITKEVDYNDTLTDKAETPTKPGKAFKGWATDASGTTPAPDSAYENLTTAKTFYAIWSDEDIQVEELKTTESRITFRKDGTQNIINDFVPTFDELKAQVKVKDANGDFVALPTDVGFSIVDDEGNEYTEDSVDLKKFIYEKVKENKTDEVSRTETVKAKVKYSDGTEREVEIPIIVLKNIYKGTDEGNKYPHIPDDYVKVTIDPTDKAQNPDKTYYYVNPKAKVIVPGKDPVGAGDNKFSKWTIKADSDSGAGTDYIFGNRQIYKEDSTITAQYGAGKIKIIYVDQNGNEIDAKYQIAGQDYSSDKSGGLGKAANESDFVQKGPDFKGYIFSGRDSIKGKHYNDPADPNNLDTVKYSYFKKVTTDTPKNPNVYFPVIFDANEGEFEAAPKDKKTVYVYFDGNDATVEKVTFKEVRDEFEKAYSNPTKDGFDFKEWQDKADKGSEVADNYEIQFKGWDWDADPDNGYIPETFYANYSAKTMDFTAKKVWDLQGARVADDEYPTMNFTLYRKVEGSTDDSVKVDGAEVKEITKDNVTATWKDLLKTNSEGKEYTYFVKETFKDTDIKNDNWITGEMETKTEGEVTTNSITNKLKTVPGQGETPDPDKNFMGKLTVKKVFENEPVPAMMRMAKGPMKAPDAPIKFKFKVTGPYGYNQEFELEAGKEKEIKDLAYGQYTVEEIESNNYTAKYVEGEYTKGTSTLSDKPANVEISKANGEKTVTVVNQNLEKPDPNFVTLEATKIWVNGPADDHKEVTINVYRQVGEDPKEKVEVKAPAELKVVRDKSDNNKFYYTWTNLPKHDKYGKAYTYTVKEDGVTDGKVKVGDNTYVVTQDGNTITNTFKVATANVTATKKWVNGPEADHTQATLNLFRQVEGGQKEQVTRVNPEVAKDAASTGTFNYTWKDLPTTDDAGKKYTYTVEEANVTDGKVKVGDNTYVVTVDNDTNTVTNTFTADNTATFTVKKVWADDVKPVPTMKFTLYRKVAGGTEEAVQGAEVKGITKDVTEATWTGLDKTDANGVTYEYSVKETFADESSDVKNANWILGTMVSDDNGNNTITNKLKTVPGDGVNPDPDQHRMGKLTITKKIESKVTQPQQMQMRMANGPHRAPAAPLAFTFKVTDPYGNVVKVDGQDTFTLKANETKVLENLLYGEYTVEETDAKGLTPFVKVDDGDETESKEGKVTLTKDAKEGTVTFTNKNINSLTNPNVIEVKASKVWVNGPSKDHTAVDLKLYRQVDGGQKEEVTVSDDKLVKTRDLSNSSKFDYVWKDLPKINDEGKEYTYTVEEANVTDGKVKVGDNTYKVTQVDNTITNTYEIPKTDNNVIGKKVWEDVPAGTTTPTVKLELWRKTSDADQGTKVIDATALDANNQADFGKQDKTDNKGNQYTYFVKEVDENGAEFKDPKYTSVVNGLTATNTKIAEDGRLTITKKLENVPVRMMMRGPAVNADPIKFKFTVTKPDGTSEEFELAANGTKTLENLPYGEYTIKETDTKGYTPFYAKDNEEAKQTQEFKVTINSADGVNVTVTNKNIINQNDLTVRATKIWVGGPITDHTAVSLTLKRLSAKAGSTEEDVSNQYSAETINNTSDSITYVWKNLPKHDGEGYAYTYRVEELGTASDPTSSEKIYKVGNNEYVSKIEEDAANTANETTAFKITNTYVVPKTAEDIVATKKWIGVPDGTKTPAVKFQLQRTANGVTKDVANQLKEVTGSQNAQGLIEVNFGKQDKTDVNGNVYVYSVKELDENGAAFNHTNYTSVVDGLSVTNTYHAPEVKYTVTYKAGSSTATGTMADDTDVRGTYTVKENGFTNPGYTFKGWKLDNGTIVQPGATITVTANVTLTAIWENTTTPPTPDPDKPNPDKPNPWDPNPWNPDYPKPWNPNYPDLPYIPRYPEIRYETIVQEKIVKVPVPIADNAYVKEVRYMQGFMGDFRPKDGLTRAEAAQILANALVEDGYKYNPDFKLPYKDIGEAWYTRAVKIVTEAKVFAGYDDGNFKPQDKITRNEWIATLKRFQELGDVSGNHMKLKDGHWAMAEIEAAYKEGWLKIYSDGLATYEGDKFIPREEVAAVSNKAFNRVLDKTYIINNDKNLITYKDVKKDMWSYEDILCASNTFLYKKDLYRAHWIKEDNNQFNINTDGFEIVKAKFQRNPR